MTWLSLMLSTLLPLLDEPGLEESSEPLPDLSGVVLFSFRRRFFFFFGLVGSRSRWDVVEPFWRSEVVELFTEWVSLEW